MDGQLAMTRAFGDGKLKEHITAEPDMSIQKIDEDTEFIILASDGLWKVQEYCMHLIITDEHFGFTNFKLQRNIPYMQSQNIKDKKY